MKTKLIYVCLLIAVLYTSALMATVIGLKASKPQTCKINHSIFKPSKY